ncbi:hypothetical protein FB446DRAFT_792128 [Lentinula raphanica]|nr:hypothetical protein FB446DRAFT_792128 [Lentinula raphanica]
MPSGEPTSSTEPTSFMEPMSSTELTSSPTALDIMPETDSMDTTVEDTPSASTDFVAPVLSDVASAGQQSSPSSDVAPATQQNAPPPDPSVDPQSPNLSNSPSSGVSTLSSGVSTLPDAAIPNSSNPVPSVIPNSSSSPVAVPVAVNSSSESQPTRQSCRGGRKKTAASGGANAGSSNPVTVTAVATDLRRSSCAKVGKRKNPVPDLCQRPAKKSKRALWVNIVPQPNGKLALVHPDGTISGYVIEDSNGKEIVVDENGQFVEMLHQHAK